MLLRIFTLFSTVSVGLVLLPNVLTTKAVQNDLSTDQKKVVDTVSTMFAAAGTEDVAKFDSAIAPGFYIDRGSRFTGEALMELLKKQHAAGRRYEWNVTEPDVHISGDTAWIAYVNRGASVTAPARHASNGLTFRARTVGRFPVKITKAAVVQPDRQVTAASGNETTVSVQ